MMIRSWEYRVEQIHTKTHTFIEERELNRCGLEGWELVAVHLAHDGQYVHLVMKREVDPPKSPPG